MYEQMEERSQAELEHYKAQLAMERATLQHQNELQLQHQQQAFERQMALREIQQPILLGVGSGAILAITAAVAYYLYTCGQAKLAEVPRAEGHEPPGGKTPCHAPRPLSGLAQTGRSDLQN